MMYQVSQHLGLQALSFFLSKQQDKSNILYKQFRLVYL